jgi:ribonuclease HI
MDRFEACHVRHVTRDKNVLADRLASAAAREAARSARRGPAQGSLDL